VCPVSVCLSVSVTSRCSIETDGWIKLIFGTEASFDLSTYPTLCCKEINVSTNITVLPSGTLSLTPDLNSFATARRSSKRVINKGGRSEHDKLDRRRSAELTIPPSTAGLSQSSPS